MQNSEEINQYQGMYWKPNCQNKVKMRCFCIEEGVYTYKNHPERHVSNYGHLSEHLFAYVSLTLLRIHRVKAVNSIVDSLKKSEKIIVVETDNPKKWNFMPE
jgi:hypothetical protein